MSAEIAAVLAAHERMPYAVCSCGWLPDKPFRVGDGQHRAHVADVLAAREQAARADALRRAADEMARRLDELPHQGRHTRARWAENWLRYHANEIEES